MPSLCTLASSLSGLVLLAASSAQETTGEWSKTNPTDADSKMLYEALGGVSSYSPEVTTYLCVYKVNDLETQSSATGATNYNFGVTGCNADKEFVGRCPDLTTFPGCGSFNIFVSSESKTDTPKVTSITGQELKSRGKCQSK